MQSESTLSPPGMLPPHVPHRKCVTETGGRGHFAKSHLLRWRNAGGRLEFDPSHSLAGRGIYLQPKRESISQAVRKNLFARAARQSVTFPRDAALLEQQVAAALSNEIIRLVLAAVRARVLRIHKDEAAFGATAAETQTHRQAQSQVGAKIDVILSRTAMVGAKERKFYVFPILPASEEKNKSQTSRQNLRARLGRCLRRAVADGDYVLDTPLFLLICLPDFGECPPQGLAARLQIMLEQLKCLSAE